jgi:capsule polysaccharide export protein KpsE/RkpR
MEENTYKNALDEEGSKIGLSLLNYIIILAKHKRLVVGVTLIVAIITLVMTLKKQSFYVAETSILPPLKQDINLTYQLLRDFGVLSPQRDSMHNKQKLMVDIIKSRTFADRVIERFGLQKVYGVKNAHKARKMFQDSLKIEPDYTVINPFKFSPRQLSLLTTIFVYDENAESAARIANGIVEELKIFFNDIAVSEASERRLFYEEQLKQVSEALIKSEEEIKKFQEETGILEVGTQSKIVIQKIASLRAEITAKDVELMVMRTYSTASNPDLQRVEATIRGLKKELSKLEAKEADSKDFLIPTGNIPTLELEYKRIYRQLKFNETLFEILVKHYEGARMDEAKEAVLIQVIDKAIPPEKITELRIFGRRKALAYTLSAFLFSCFLAFSMEIYQKYSNKQEYKEKINALRDYLSFRERS